MRFFNRAVSERRFKPCPILLELSRFSFSALAFKFLNSDNRLFNELLELVGVRAWVKKLLSVLVGVFDLLLTEPVSGRTNWT